MRSYGVYFLIVVLAALLAIGAFQVLRRSASSDSPTNAQGVTGLTESIKQMYADPATRAKAVRTMGAQRLVDADRLLMEATKDTDDIVRAAACTSLARIATEANTTEIRKAIEICLNDPIAAVRNAAAAALGEMADGAGVFALARSAADADPAVRLAAVSALAATEGDEATVALADKLADPDATVWRTAADALVARGGKALDQVDRLLGARGAPPLTAIAYVLAEIGSTETAGRLVKVLQFAKLPPPAVERAVSALAAIGSAAVEPLAEGIVHRAQPLAIKQRAAMVVRRIGPEAAKPVAEYILAWQVFPRLDELKLWVELLEAIGGDDAEIAEALRRAKAQLAEDAAG